MILVITGPTSVGKTNLSIELAKKYDGEIINADSMQFYKGLDIGTAKIKEEEKENIPHHLFDILSVNDNYSIFDYQNDCRKVINNIIKRGKTPIIVGGTGLYLKAALYDYKLSQETNNDTYDEFSNEQLYNKLIALDKDIIIDKDNRRRLVRAINYYLENNSSINNNKTNTLLYDCLFIGLTTSRYILYDRINTRVDKMMEDGLLDEVKKYHDANIRSKALTNGIGYKELYNYLDKKITLEEAILKVKQNSRHYAKRQYTFFNNQMNINWFNVDFNNFKKTVLEITNYINSNLS